MSKRKVLTEKQARFVQEYLVDLNATQAYIRAGYKARGNAAHVNASRLLSNAKVAEEVRIRQEKRTARIEVEQDYVLRRLLEIDQMDVLDILTDDMSFKPLKDWPKTWRQFLSGLDLTEIFEGQGDDRKIVGVLKKIKWPDKVKNLELLGRHQGNFRDKLDVRLDVADLSDEDIERELAALASSGVIPDAEKEKP